MSEEKQEGMPEAEFAELLQTVSTVAPLLKSILAPTDAAPHGEGHSACQRREALLCAMKPYLSPARREAVDYLIRLARVGDAIRALK